MPDKNQVPGKSTAAQRRAAATTARGPAFIKALKAERASLQQRGLTDRVKQVDEQIKLYGGGPKTTAADTTPRETR